MKTWIIYEHISPSGKVYVGIISKKTPNARWEGGNGYSSCKLFHRAIKKYGWENIIHKVIATGLGEGTAKNMERDLIAYYKSKNISYNMTDGGDGIIGIPKSDLQRATVGKLWKNKKIPQEIRLKMSKAHLGKPLTEAHKENIRKSKLGNKNGNKAVLALKDNKVVYEFSSCVEASKILGTHPNCISRCCRGEVKTWHGYTLVYKNNRREESLYNKQRNQIH